MYTRVFDHITTALIKDSSQKNGAVAFVYLGRHTHTCMRTYQLISVVAVGITIQFESLQ